MLTSIIRRIFSLQSPKRSEANASAKDPIRDQFPQLPKGGMVKAQDDVVILSNADPNEDRLSSLLSGINGKADGGSGNTTSDDVKVDITLRTQLGQAPMIMLLFSGDHGDGNATAGMKTSTISISFEVGLNGRITVVDTGGLLDMKSTSDGKQAESSTGPESEDAELRKKISRVLETSQDLGILVEWVLRWKRQRSGR